MNREGKRGRRRESAERKDCRREGKTENVQEKKRGQERGALRMCRHQSCSGRHLTQEGLAPEVALGDTLRISPSLEWSHGGEQTEGVRVSK